MTRPPTRHRKLDCRNKVRGGQPTIHVLGDKYHHQQWQDNNFFVLGADVASHQIKRQGSVALRHSFKRFHYSCAASVNEHSRVDHYSYSSITSSSLFVYFDVINSSCLSERIRLQIIPCLHFSLNPMAVVMDNFLAFALLLSVFTLSGNMKACDWLCKFHERDHAKECRDMLLLTSWNRNYFSPLYWQKDF